MTSISENSHHDDAVRHAEVARLDRAARDQRDAVRRITGGSSFELARRLTAAALQGNQQTGPQPCPRPAVPCAAPRLVPQPSSAAQPHPSPRLSILAAEPAHAAQAGVTELRQSRNAEPPEAGGPSRSTPRPGLFDLLPDSFGTIGDGLAGLQRRVASKSGAAAARDHGDDQSQRESKHHADDEPSHPPDAATPIPIASPSPRPTDPSSPEPAPKPQPIPDSVLQQVMSFCGLHRGSDGPSIAIGISRGPLAGLTLQLASKGNRRIEVSLTGGDTSSIEALLDCLRARGLDAVLAATTQPVGAVA